ncbi:MAG: tetratricopeptide repeat protein [Magnetococcales bacterium]|nr:tetratricopeptide repeat protein [Magnetococcales bacterium]
MHEKSIDTKQVLAQTAQYFQNGQYDKTRELCLTLLTRHPNNVDIFHLLGLTAHKKGDYSEAKEWLGKAINQQEHNPTLFISLGNAIFDQGLEKEAIEHYKKAISLDPNCIEAHFYLGHALYVSGAYNESIEALHTTIALQFEHHQAHLEIAKSYEKTGLSILSDTHHKIGCHLKNSHTSLPHARDSFFLDRDLARKTALQKNYFPQTPAVNGLQVCYYSGLPCNDAPENLINIPMDELENFFIESNLRFPKAVEFSLENKISMIEGIKLSELLERIQGLKRKLTHDYCIKCISSGPIFRQNERLRVFLTASRLTTVLQYSSRNLAKSLKKLGCDVCLIVEERNIEENNFVQVMKKKFEHNPHVVINIDHLSNTILHPNVFNVVWWQDLMPEISEGKILPWRERDIALSAYPQFDPYIEKTGAKKVYRQDLCVDTDIFRPIIPLENRKKIVFVGSSHRLKVKINKESIAVIKQLKNMMDEGYIFTNETLHVLCDTYNIKSFSYMRDNLFLFVVRDGIVEWLCSMANTLDLDVEIYGRWWEENEIVRPYFKGELKHGEELARIYNESRYAISATGYVVKSQRLSEIAACGCLPVVYDARPFCEPPHWDNECLFFRTRDQLRQQFSQTPQGDPMVIARNSSYDGMAINILDMIRNHLRECNGGDFLPAASLR